MNMNVETKQFISENIDKDLHQLTLQSNRFTLVDFPLAIRQISGKQKIRNKIPSFYNNQNIHYPAQLSLEQSSSETTAIYKSSRCEGNSLVDLTGGFGVDCYFLSSHFKHVIYIEQQAELCKLAELNFLALGANHIQIVNSETEKFLTEMHAVDWIYIDPARRNLAGKKLVLISDCEPNVVALLEQIMKKADNVMIKLSPMMDVSAAIHQLHSISEIHILAIENECKEILLILNHDLTKNIQVRTINFGKNNQNQCFDFIMNDETESNSTFTSEPGKYLYEPNAAVMKSGAFKMVGNYYKLLKLHINTHLYTSNELKTDFPGRIFEVNKIWGNSKYELKELVKLIPKANISTRNYPLTVDELRKKVKIRDGGDTFIFACTLSNEQKVLIECKKLQF